MARKRIERICGIFFSILKLQICFFFEEKSIMNCATISTICILFIYHNDNNNNNSVCLFLHCRRAHRTTDRPTYRPSLSLIHQLSGMWNVVTIVVGCLAAARCSIPCPICQAVFKQAFVSFVLSSFRYWACLRERDKAS